MYSAKICRKIFVFLILIFVTNITFSKDRVFSEIRGEIYTGSRNNNNAYSPKEISNTQNLNKELRSILNVPEYRSLDISITKPATLIPFEELSAKQGGYADMSWFHSAQGEIFVTRDSIKYYMDVISPQLHQLFSKSGVSKKIVNQNITWVAKRNAHNQLELTPKNLKEKLIWRDDSEFARVIIVEPKKLFDPKCVKEGDAIDTVVTVYYLLAAYTQAIDTDHLNDSLKKENKIQVREYFYDKDNRFLDSYLLISKKINPFYFNDSLNKRIDDVFNLTILGWCLDDMVIKCYSSRETWGIRGEINGSFISSKEAEQHFKEIAEKKENDKIKATPYVVFLIITTIVALILSYIGRSFLQKSYMKHLIQLVAACAVLCICFGIAAERQSYFLAGLYASIFGAIVCRFININPSELLAETFKTTQEERIREAIASSMDNRQVTFTNGSTGRIESTYGERLATKVAGKAAGTFIVFGVLTPISWIVLIIKSLKVFIKEIVNKKQGS